MNNQQSETGRGVGMTILNVVGQCGPLIGTRLYPDRDAPGYVRGMAVCAGAMAGVVVLAGVLRVVLVRENRRRARAVVEASAGLDDEEEEAEPLAGAKAGKRRPPEAFVMML